MAVDKAPIHISQEIRGEALRLGFDAVGFAKAELAPFIGQELKEFCQAGHYGDMGWLETSKDVRAHPKNLWPQAKSVVALALSYDFGWNSLVQPRDSRKGMISRYARHRDYHDVIKKKLRQLARFMVDRYGGELKIFVDTAPVMEKPLAQQAGLGWQGKHTNLVSREMGSWFFLAILYTSLDLKEDGAMEDHCGTCRQCLDICPTQAFLGPHRLDAKRCISYLTIEHKGPVDPALRPLLGNRIYGCDDCLAVCPWNKYSKPGREEALQPRADLEGPALLELVHLTDETFRAFFRFSPIKRIGRDRFVRNVLYAIGNSGDSNFAAPVLPLLTDPSPLVKGSAIWALSRLLPKSDLLKLHQSDPREEIALEWQRALN